MTFPSTQPHSEKQQNSAAMSAWEMLKYGSSVVTLLAVFFAAGGFLIVQGSISRRYGLSVSGVAISQYVSASVSFFVIYLALILLGNATVRGLSRIVGR